MIIPAPRTRWNWVRFVIGGICRLRLESGSDGSLYRGSCRWATSYLPLASDPHCQKRRRAFDRTFRIVLRRRLFLVDAAAHQSLKALIRSSRIVSGNGSMRRAQFSYDEVPYSSEAFPQAHPDRLATVGRLFGLQTTSVERCRVLELGCASG